MARLFCFCLMLVTLLVAVSLYSTNTTSDGQEELLALADLIFEPTAANAQRPDFLGPLPIDVDVNQSHLPGPPHAPMMPARPLDWPGSRPDDDDPSDNELRPVSWATTGTRNQNGTVVNSAHPGYPRTATTEPARTAYPTPGVEDRYATAPVRSRPRCPLRQVP